MRGRLSAVYVHRPVFAQQQLARACEKNKKKKIRLTTLQFGFSDGAVRLRFLAQDSKCVHRGGTADAGKGRTQKTPQEKKILQPCGARPERTRRRVPSLINWQQRRPKVPLHLHSIYYHQTNSGRSLNQGLSTLPVCASVLGALRWSRPLAAELDPAPNPCPKDCSLSAQANCTSDTYSSSPLSSGLFSRERFCFCTTAVNAPPAPLSFGAEVFARGNLPLELGLRGFWRSRVPCLSYLE
mmetsp:Transcript_28064/g.65456  ORF Transcript_28064/g.65456 Transcript_28064/m.65456 type:complete len:240 (+) Transcript_28064:3-722(+)